MSEPLLKVLNLGVRFGAFTAVDDVSFDLAQGETLGLVGESGSGKSTLARAILRLIPVTTGGVFVDGENLMSCGSAELRRRRRDLQMVFQDPLASLDPRMSVSEILAEPLRIHERSLSTRERDDRIAAMMDRVGLSISMLRRHPHTFSGGQCQRIGIARAMMLRPKILVCDEAVSSLDVSIQGQIVNLLADLQREFGTSMLFISHNLAVVRHLSHRVMVIYRGRLVETAECDVLFAKPAHPYTRALLAAVPDPTHPVECPPSSGPDDASGASPGEGGCAYHDRCAYALTSCRSSVPPLQEVGRDHLAACHRWREVVYS